MKVHFRVPDSGASDGSKLPVKVKTVTGWVTAGEAIYHKDDDDFVVEFDPNTPDGVLITNALGRNIVDDISISNREN